MITITGLKKQYKSFSLNIDLTVKQGSITGLVGQNGAGKSTTFKAVLGLISVDGGSVSVLGKESRALTAEDREKWGIVLSDSGFSGYLTVKDILPILKSMYCRFDGDFFARQMERFGLPYDKQIKDFSTGMKAKLKVLTALSHGAELLILDEPTAGLDVVARDEVLDLLRDYMTENEKRAILISSHISSDLETLCDDIYMIHEGRIVLHEDTHVLLGEYALLKMNEEQYAKLDRQYILAVKQEAYGYCCLTDQKRYYLENAPAITVENGRIDDIITMMIKGEKP